MTSDKRELISEQRSSFKVLLQELLPVVEGGPRRSDRKRERERKRNRKLVLISQIKASKGMVIVLSSLFCWCRQTC